MRKYDEVTTITPAIKTRWQKFYSALGFWKYYFYDDNNDYRAMIYWCCFPVIKYFRKYDLFSYKVRQS